MVVRGGITVVHNRLLLTKPPGAKLKMKVTIPEKDGARKRNFQRSSPDFGGKESPPSPCGFSCGMLYYKNFPERGVSPTEKRGVKIAAQNRKAYHDYFIDEKFECGIELFGTEVKSIRMGKCSVKEAFVRIDKNEVYIYGMHINPYEKGNIFNKDPLRARKLLMHRSEINKLEGKIREKGLTLVPLQVYFKGSLVKVEIGLARGKKLYDKRDDIAKKDARREVERDYKQKLR